MSLTASWTIKTTQRADYSGPHGADKTNLRTLWIPDVTFQTASSVATCYVRNKLRTPERARPKTARASQPVESSDSHACLKQDSYGALSIPKTARVNHARRKLRRNASRKAYLQRVPDRMKTVRNARRDFRGRQ